MSESQGANDAKELYSEIVVENLSERSKGFAQGSKSQGPEGQSPEQPEIENSSEMSQSQRYIKDVIQGSENHNILDKQKPVELKDVKKLTSEEREQIISNFKNGIDNEFYDVKTLKNGTTRIVKKKNKSQSLSNKLISGQSPSGLHDRSSSKDNEQFVKPEKKYLSNEQLLMEHIIELNTQMNKLKNKQKKLKNKYKGIKRDLYVDVDENDEPHNDEKDFIQGDRNRPPSEELEKNAHRVADGLSDLSANANEVRVVQRGWRSRVSYL